jgi:ERF superfamily protein
MEEQKLPETVTLESVFEVTHSETIGKLVLALAKAQLQFKPIFKQTENAAFVRAGKASKYADLATYIDATQEALAKEELVVLQWPDVTPDAKTMTLESILAHSSGEWMRGRLTLPALGRDGFTAQSCGSSITYARRYSYAAIVGAASEDDDANAASGRGTSEAAQEVAKAKIEALRPSGSVPALFYVWFDESQTAEITGDVGLKKANEDLLKPLKLGNKLIASADQLEGLKYQFEQRKVEFRPLKAANA